MSIKFATVCSGIGSVEFAASFLEWECLFQSEILESSKKVLQYHFPNVKLYGDFTKELNHEDWLDKIDCLVAGTPCQSFSVSGRQEGITEARGQLTLEYIRLIRSTNTPWAILENVSGLLNKDFGIVLNEITGREDLSGYKQWPTAGFIEQGVSGYSAAWRILDARYSGIPQQRRRVFVIIHAGSWRAPARVLFEQQGNDWTTKTKRELEYPLERISRNSKKVNKDLIALACEAARANSYIDLMPTILARTSRTSAFIREIITEDFKKLERVRYLTPIETERLFGLPDNYTNIPGVSLSARYKMLGNAIVIPVIRELLERLEWVNKSNKNFI